MSISSLQSSIQRAHSDIASLTNKLSDLTRKLADKNGRLADAQNAASRATSTNTKQSKLREVTSLLKDMADIEKDKASVEKQIGDKKNALHRAEQELAREQERETKQQIEAEKKRMREMEKADEQRKRKMAEYQRDLDRELTARRTVGTLSADSESAPEITVKKHDVFISHASEDKDDFVRPLAVALTAVGLDVWYDETSLRLGDSLRQSIDKGLINSRFGLVILSASFFAKNWPQYELNGMVAREMNGVNVILPIWHKVTKDEVLKYSPTLSDKVALNSSMYSVSEIAEKIAEVVRC